MRVVTWNVHRARADSGVWDILWEISPDIAVLEEVVEIPVDFSPEYHVVERYAVQRNGKRQRFKTAILVRGRILRLLPLKHADPRVSLVIERFVGNILPVDVILDRGVQVRVVACHIPHWSLNGSFVADLLDDALVRELRAGRSNKIWLTELLWAWLTQFTPFDGYWVVAGDFNVAETFGPVEANNVIIRRFYDLGLRDALRWENSGQPVPTYMNPSNHAVVHQLDYLFVNPSFARLLRAARVYHAEKIFGGGEYSGMQKRLSDHLPVIADFDL